MTYFEIDKAIVNIMKEKCHECKKRLDSISRENVTERKAVQLELGVYNFCGNAGLLQSDDREKWLQKRKIFLNKELHKYPKLNEIYQNLKVEEKMRFVAALQSEIFIRDQWLGVQYAALSSAEASGEPQNIFELNIKIGAVENMFAAWENWRVENNIYPNMFEEA